MPIQKGKDNSGNYIDDINIAVCHANWNNGGGEVVAEELTRLFDADLYYCYKTGGSEPPSDLNSTQLYGGPIGRRSQLIRDLRYMWSNTYIDELYNYDLIIQSGNPFVWFVPKDDQTVVRYAHTTPRTPYDLYYERGKRTLTKLYSTIARVILPNTTNYATKIICNSELVANRFRKYLPVNENQLDIIYPPVNTTKWKSEGTEKKENLFVTWSRIEPQKRIDNIVEAFIGRDERLVVCGDGSQYNKIKRMARGYDNIEIWGYTDQEKLTEIVSAAEATIFAAQNEDFGLVPVESAAAGTPILGINDGYTSYQINEGVNGWFHDGTVQGIEDAIEKYQSCDLAYDQEDLQKWSNNFSKKTFRSKMKKSVKIALDQDNIETSIEW